MVDENNIIEELEQGGEKKSKKKAKSTKKKTVKAAGLEVKRKEGKDDNYLFTLVIVAVVILGIIGIVFGYTKDKLSELKKGGNEVTKELSAEVDNLKQKLAAVEKTTDNLEKDNETNREVVIDLFDKNRTIPTNVDATGWKVFDGKDMSFSVSFPQKWETVRPIIETEPKEGKPVEEMLYLQPIGQAEYINTITIKSDYADFAAIELAQKVEIFSELNLVDERDFAFGKMMYFINLDQDNREVPTILILTDDNIYRATFNVSDKKTPKYFEYRKDFEEIVSTFIQVIEVVEEEVAPTE